MSGYATELSAALERHGIDVARFSLGRRVRPVPEGSRHLAVPSRVLDRTWKLVVPPRAEHLLGHVDVVHAAGPVPVPSRRPAVRVVRALATLAPPRLPRPPPPPTPPP